jgi:hypothetical protein
MKKHFSTYKQALSLKELGFDEPCLLYFNKGELKSHNQTTTEGANFNNQLDSWVSAPTKQQIFEWFRKNYRLSVLIYDLLDDCEAHIIEWTLTEDKIVHEFPLREDIEYPNNRFDSWEEAESACIDKLIELIKNK